MKKITVKNFHIKGGNIIATITDGTTVTDMTIDKDEYEHWVTEGKGVVTYPMTYTEGGAIQETTVTHTIEEYWTIGREVNDSEICAELARFIDQSITQSQIARGEIAAEKLVSLFGSSETMRMITDYGVGMHGKGLNEMCNVRMRQIRQPLNSEPIVSTENHAA